MNLFSLKKPLEHQRLIRKMANHDWLPLDACQRPKAFFACNRLAQSLV